MTYDGVNVNNNFQSTDGFFSMVTPRLDAVEEVTVTGATPTADQAALGAVQVAFVTRSGTNNFDGSLYHYFRHPDLNSNYYFNKIRGLERNDVVVHQYGGRIGGPIVIPGLLDGRNKAFFFFNMEEFYQPTEASRTRTILHPRAQEGWFRYNVTVGGVSAGARGQPADAGAAEQSAGGTRSGHAGAAREHPVRRRDGGHDHGPHQSEYAAVPSIRAPAPTSSTRQPGRVDVNLSSNHRLSGSYSWGRLMTSPDILNNNDAPFPGLSGLRTVAVVPDGRLDQPAFHALADPRQRVAGGWQWSPLEFSTNVTPGMFDQQGGFGWNFTAANMFGLTSPGNLTGLEDRTRPTGISTTR